jgi:hypothetical protein
MPVTTTFTFDELSTLIVAALKASATLSYVPDEAIVVSPAVKKDILPQFKNYLIRISPTDSGYVEKVPRIGQYYRNIYSVAIELWIKSGLKVADRLTRGIPGQTKGLYEFHQDVISVLEHNTFSSQLDPFAGPNCSNPVHLEDIETQTEGLGFVWIGNQDNTN